MSIREDTSPPDCPYCGSEETAVSDRPNLGRFSCLRCSGYFAGTTEEWNRYFHQRPERLREADDGT